MLWECGECGSLVERGRPPAKCRSCGIAGAIFVPADEAHQPDGDENTLRDLWIQSGFDWAAISTQTPSFQIA